ncbi:MAG: ABC transporter permease [Terrimicrobiaceae bacterium]|nr:ABC transporter permease [Terrimicrobiaceae bacterium]
MTRLLVLLRREVGRNFGQPSAWIFMACFLALTGVNFQTAVAALNREPSTVTAVEAFFNSLLFWFPFLLAFPLLTMRLFAEEYKLGTIETLMTAPVRDSEVVLAKFGGALIFYLVLWAPTPLYFAAFAWVSGQPAADSVGAFLGAYAIVVLAGIFYLSLGALASALTDNQIVAAAASGAMVCLAFFAGLLGFFFPNTSPTLRQWVYHFSTIEHFADFTRGVLDSRPVVFYFTGAAFVLFLTYHALQWRRWRA